LARQAVGVDLLAPGRPVSDFVRADIRRLPFRSGSVDLVTLRFVVEHFRVVDPYMQEIARVLRPGGRVIILTTNALSPPIAIPRLLPFPLKHRILSALFQVAPKDLFQAYHRMNTPGRFRREVGPFELRRLEILSDINYVRRWVFWILLAWHQITRPMPLRRFRMNLLAVLEKTDAQRTTATLPSRDPSAPQRADSPQRVHDEDIHRPA
jgi:SAM-dependent methyltransferase